MPASAPPSLTEELAAALDWWREAGVDRAFADEAEGWLAPPVEEQAEEPRQAAPTAAKQAPPPPVPRPLIGGDPAGWPADLATFRDWWLAEPSLDEGGISPRVPPRGPAQADLMVIVAMPENSDGEVLLSGKDGRFLSAILQALGTAEERVYFASALSRHTPLPDTERLVSDGLGNVLAHHVGLVAPKRILAFGRIVPPLLGHDMAQGPAAIRNFNHEGIRVPVIAAGGLERLLRSAAAREAFWRRWLDRTDDTA